MSFSQFRLNSVRLIVGKDTIILPLKILVISKHQFRAPGHCSTPKIMFLLTHEITSLIRPNMKVCLFGGWRLELIFVSIFLQGLTAKDIKVFFL